MARNLKKSYDSFEAVKGVDFEVHRGECFGFLGPNGAGKTTTMKMIYGAVIPTSGELDVAGLDVRRCEREIKRRIGVVPQDNNLDDELKVKENLLVYGRYYDLPRKLALQRADELLDFVQLTEKADSRVEQLSGGMKRRLLIARALINDPEIVVLDEPTTGLDPQARHLVWDRLRALAAEGKTLLLTTHYMEEAARLCDRLVIMEGGLIIAEGSPKELIAEHVSPQVLEFRASPEELERLRPVRSEEHTSELQSRQYLVCRLLLEKTKKPSPSPALTGPLSSSSPRFPASLSLLFSLPSTLVSSIHSCPSFFSFSLILYPCCCRQIT